MFSLKIALFALLSFATLALATPTSRGQQPQNPKALIASSNVVLKQTLLPLSPCHFLLRHIARLFLTVFA
jgi:hypothetical protein